MVTRILVVDDEEDFRNLLVKRLNRKSFSATGAASGLEALDFLADRVFEVALIDLKMPGMEGLELLQRIKKNQSETEVVVLTGHGTTESAVEAMKLGAYDYLTKPVNLKELQVLLDKAVEKASLKRQNQGLKAALERENVADQRLTGTSRSIKQLKQLIGKVANSDSPVLVIGESGTGKELVSRALHYESHRTEAPFIVVNCGALPEQLMESELFGHEKGAFTGAQERKPGLVEMAEGGSLFLDEIGELPLGLQTKLLRFMENGEFRRVGDNRLRWVETRIIAATNRVLEQEIEAGNFREDLYYRLNVVKIAVPPLRERGEDVPLLVEHFMKKMALNKQMSSEALKELQKYHFPGNVRELRNLVERGILLSEGQYILSEDMFGCVQKVTATTLTLKEVERNHIECIMRRNNWNKKRTAEILGISVRNLYRKLENYEIEPE